MSTYSSAQLRGDVSPYGAVVDTQKQKKYVYHYYCVLLLIALIHRSGVDLLVQIYARNFTADLSLRASTPAPHVSLQKGYYYLVLRNRSHFIYIGLF